MALALHHRFNVDEYYEMAEKGILKPDARVDLLKESLSINFRLVLDTMALWVV